jgi:DNA-binding protein H-NS
VTIDLKTLNHNQLNDLIARARSRQDELEKEKVLKLRERITALIQAEGFSVDEFFGRSNRGPRGKSKGAGVKVKPKYSNPLDPTQTWTGRGKRPRWFLAAIASGKTDKDMLIVG